MYVPRICELRALKLPTSDPSAMGAQHFQLLNSRDSGARGLRRDVDHTVNGEFNLVLQVDVLLYDPMKSTTGL